MLDFILNKSLGYQYRVSLHFSCLCVLFHTDLIVAMWEVLSIQLCGSSM